MVVTKEIPARPCYLLPGDQIKYLYTDIVDNEETLFFELTQPVAGSNTPAFCLKIVMVTIKDLI